MKKIFAILVAAMLIMALAVNVFADERVVYDNPAGEVPTSCEDPWGSFGVAGDTWERGTSCDLTVEELIALCEEGGYTFSYVYGGEPATWSDSAGAPTAVINADWDNGVAMTYTELGDGKYEASIALDDLIASYNIAPADIWALAIQNWTGNFVLYSAKITNGADAAPAAPVADAEPEAPAAEPETPAAEAPATTTAPATGLALAVVPAVMALAAVAVSKKR